MQSQSLHPSHLSWYPGTNFLSTIKLIIFKEFVEAALPAYRQAGVAAHWEAHRGAPLRTSGKALNDWPKGAPLGYESQRLGLREA